jgi:hypothetical protein
LNEVVLAETPSEPFLFAGWPQRMAWLHNSGEKKADFLFEIDKNGTGEWEILQSVTVPAGAVHYMEFAEETPGEWIRVTPNVETRATVHFSYSSADNRTSEADRIFESISFVEDQQSIGGLLYPLGENRRALGMAVVSFEAAQAEETGYYELDTRMQLIRKEDPETESYIRNHFSIPEQLVTIEESSVLIVDDLGRRWRLPLGSERFTGLTNTGKLRLCREVVTERDLLNCHGTFYELPADNADGFAKVRPIASHHLRIHDYASYRGMLIMTGVQIDDDKDDLHIIRSEDGKAAVWAGVIDDLWKLGKPTGYGGPWKDSEVEANIPSDPYLIGFYDQKELSLSHTSSEPILFTVEADPSGHGPWMKWQEIRVESGETYTYTFPDSFQARWIRFTTDQNCTATAWLEYR